MHWMEQQQRQSHTTRFCLDPTLITMPTNGANTTTKTEGFPGPRMSELTGFQGTKKGRVMDGSESSGEAEEGSDACILQEGASRRLRLPLLSADLSQVNHTLGVAPLVVVPGHNLDHVVTHDHGQ